MNRLPAGNTHLGESGERLMEPATSKRARILSKPDLTTAIAVVVVILLVNAVMLMILF